MERWSGRVALVTGASAGIGAAICRRLVEAGMVVVGAARASERIEAISKDLEGKPGKLVAVKCDLTKDEDVANLFSFIKKEYKGVDVCINNAAISYNKGLLDGTLEEWRYVMNLNVIALCQCTKESVNSMRERGVDDGHVIHLNSTVGHNVLPYPGINFYSATKHAVTALTEGLRNELRLLQSNIRISSVSPGCVKTEGLGNFLGSEEAAQQMYQSIPHLAADDVAASICHILAAPANVQIHELMICPVGEGEISSMLQD